MTCKNVPFVRILAVAAPLLVASQVMAQEGGGGAEQSSAIADFFKYQNCGTVGYLIMVLSVIAGALMIENFMNIKREKLAPPDLLNDIEALFDGENFISAIAPMMGLFGTVTGMFVTFGTIAAAGGSVSPATLASGIKMALITTILGLTVAIPVGIAFYYLRNRVIRVSTEINAISENLFERFRSKN